MGRYYRLHPSDLPSAHVKVHHAQDVAAARKNLWTWLKAFYFEDHHMQFLEKDVTTREIGEHTEIYGTESMDDIEQ